MGVNPHCSGTGNPSRFHALNLGRCRGYPIDPSKSLGITRSLVRGEESTAE